MRKKIVLFMSIMVLFASSLSVYAAETNSMPRAVSCGKCEGGRLFERIEVRAWTESFACSHGHPDWKDTYNWQGDFSVIECNKCNAVSESLISRYLRKLTCGPNG